MTNRIDSRFLALALVAGLSLPAVTRAQSAPSPVPLVADASGAVFTATNGTSRNEVLAYRRSASGALTFIGTFPTGGRGSGGGVDPLQSQHSLLLSEDHRFLFATNSGSGDVSAFAVLPDARLRLLNRAPSSGGFPNALAIRGDLLYVLNAGGAGSVSGFYGARTGQLLPILDSTRLLSAPSAGGASIDFSPDGTTLAATERLTNRIDTFPIEADGKAGVAVVNPSVGRTPFSLTFTPQGALLVAEANGNPRGGSAVSSYVVRPGQRLSVVTPSAPLSFAVACWIVATANGRYAYTANAASNELSQVSIAEDGKLSVSSSISTGAGTIPLDLALAGNDRFLYTLTAGTGTITAFRVNPNGSLALLERVRAQLPASGQGGLAAF